MHNNYLTELVVKQKGNRVEGVFGYYFRDKYQSIFIHGTFNPKTREVIILNIPVIYYGSNSTVNSIDCNMNFRGVIINSKLGSALKGYFYHDERYKFMCPDLKVSYELDRDDQQADSVFKVASTSRMWKPQADDYVVEVKAPAPKANVLPAEKNAGPVDTPAVMTKPVSKPDPVVVTEKKVVVDSPRLAVVVSPVDSGKAVAHTDSVKAGIDSTRAAVAAVAALDAGAASAAAFARLPWRLSNDALASSLVRSRLMKTLLLTYGSCALRRCLASARMLLTASTEPSETRSRRLFVDLEGFPRRADFMTV